MACAAPEERSTLDISISQGTSSCSHRKAFSHVEQNINHSGALSFAEEKVVSRPLMHRLRFVVHDFVSDKCGACFFPFVSDKMMFGFA